MHCKCCQGGVEQRIGYPSQGGTVVTRDMSRHLLQPVTSPRCVTLLWGTTDPWQHTHCSAAPHTDISLGLFMNDVFGFQSCLNSMLYYAMQIADERMVDEQ